jgi:hypothetical protein
MPDDYQVPDDPDAGRMDAGYLRSCLGLRAKPGEEPPQLPTAVRRAYYDMSRSLSILGATRNSMDPTQLATVVALALREGVQAEGEEQTLCTFLDEVKGGRVTTGQKVVIHWRNKDRPAHFLGAHDGKMLVLHGGSDVNVRPDLVRFPEAGEFPGVADNINQPSEVP